MINTSTYDFLTPNNKIIQIIPSNAPQIILSCTSPITGDSLKFSIMGYPERGSIAPGTVSTNVFYVPMSKYAGTGKFTYKATDGQGKDSRIATVTIMVVDSSMGSIDPLLRGGSLSYKTKWRAVVYEHV